MITPEQCDPSKGIEACCGHCPKCRYDYAEDAARKPREPHHLEAMIGDYLQKLERQQRDKFYRAGLEAAARMAENYADQCCGGSGEGGEGYRNLAAAQRRINPATGY